jgi:hypothetical protein
MRRDFWIGIFIGLAVFGLAIYFRSPRADSALPKDSTVPATNRYAMPRLPAPRLSGSTEPAEPLGNSPTNLLAMLMDKQTNVSVRVSVEQLRDYLDKNHRSVESLLGAYRASRDESLLKEAEEKYPNDPRVAFDAAFFGAPEERRKWLDALKQSAPDNALANYLSAADYFKSGQNDLALQELASAGSKGYADYSRDFIQNSDEAFQAAGYSRADAQIIAGADLLLPHLSQLKQDGVNLVDLAKSYQQSGDTASAQAALQMAMSLGQRLNQADAQTVIDSLVGIAVERLVLGAMDPNDPNVQSQVAALIQQREAWRDLSRQGDKILTTLSDEEAAVYFERWKMFGAQSALQWLVNKYGEPVSNVAPAQ